MSGPVLTRRALGHAAGALVVALALPPSARAADAKLPGSLQTNRMLDGWLRIDADGTVTVFTGKVELGQGIVTALAQVAADELDVALGRVRIVTADTGATPDEGFTSGSQSIEYSGTALRYACAEARGLLLDAAAARLNTPKDGLAVEDGTIGGAGAETSYWALAPEVALKREATASVAPKPPEQLKLIGQPVARRDIPAKVTGGAAYVQDLRLPGMLHGRVVRPPSYDAELVALDEEPVRRLPGVVAVVRDGRFLGVVAEREEQAIAAREALRRAATWREPESRLSPKEIHAHLRALPSEDHEIGRKGGDAPAGAAATLAATYTRPYQAHASIGPSCALAQWEGRKLTVWTHAQGVFPLRRDLAKVFDLGEAEIRAVHLEGSGCYGHNGADDVALDAALLARAAGGRPVRVQWMRDDEFAWEPFGAAMAMSAAASLDGDGAIVDWRYELWSNTHSTRPGAKGGVNLLAAWHLAKPHAAAAPDIIPQPAGGGDRNAVPLYDFPRQRIVHHFVPAMPIRVSALRALGGYANVFAIESFMDELAHAAKADPVAFRLKHLNDPRARAVIEAAARQAGWQGGAASGGGRGRGIGFAKYKNLAAYLAVVAEVEVERSSGAVRLARAVAAIDAGQVVNPDGLRNQTEGGIIQSASWTLKEQVAFDGRRVTARDWAAYPILTFPEIPAVEVVVLERPHERSLGAGEAAQGPMAAAIGNAIADATGVRLRDLPLTPDKVKAALG